MYSFNDSESRKQKLWSDCTNAQADLGFAFSYMPEGTFWSDLVHLIAVHAFAFISLSAQMEYFVPKVMKLKKINQM